ncbi:MAG: division/cell wall cluster transcriptional repressor MraZ [Pseudomonadota bacterium]
MFRGPSKVSVDAKGRMAIPTRYRELIAERCDNRLVATIDRDGCLVIYPYPDWQDIERKLARLPSLNKTAKRLQRLMLGHADEMTLDPQGRININNELLAFAGIKKQAMLVGQVHKFELWDVETWAARRATWLDEEDDGDDLPQLESLVL